jgi:hypothetical protein
MSSKTKRRVSGRVATSEETKGNPNLTRRFSSATEFNPDYSQVKIGLKRIGVLAATFIVILVALTFILK